MDGLNAALKAFQRSVGTDKWHECAAQMLGSVYRNN